jgi:hypothetical protein
MADMIKYGKTTDFKSCVRGIKHKVRFSGLDEQGEPIYNNDPLPVLTFKGTVKLHGTNASISWQDGQLHCQSRSKVVTEGHYGFPEMINQEIYAVNKMVDAVRMNSDIQHGEKLTIYGEWAGPGIQKGVAVSRLGQKIWFPFAAKITDLEGNGRWVRNACNHLHCDSGRVKSIYDFEIFVINIDLNNPAESQNKLIEIADAVEARCPVAATLIPDDPSEDDKFEFLGEGVVWECFYLDDRYTFKVKGKEHAVTKIKTLKPVDMDLLGRCNDFVDYCVTENRVKQAMFEVKPKNAEMGLTKSDTGAILKWMASDIIEEEVFEMKEQGLEWANVAGIANARARQIFFMELDKV